MTPILPSRATPPRRLRALALGALLTLATAAPAAHFGQYATLNVSASLKDEMRRIQYWKHN